MKVNFTKALNYAPEWEGNSKLPADQQFHVILKPVLYSDMLKIREAFRESKKEGENADPQVIFDVAQSILPRYVTVNGLEDNDGPVTIQDVAIYPMYLGLTMELLFKLSTLSMPTDGDEKNSQPPQG